ncbi:MAG: hypothetical protein H6742_06515 [Alphaproteobacteria bacterium]|nr:hypothetical protein [Alphaproteobacteria bacterium]
MSLPTAKDLARAAVAATYEVTIGERVHQVRVARLGDASCGIGRRYGIQLDDGPIQVVETSQPQPDVLNLLVGDATWEAGVDAIEDGFSIDLLGIRHEVGVVDPRRKALRTAEGAGGGALKTAMPGRIVRLLVAVGDVVAKGDPMVVVEAMKMENELKAPGDGTVTRIAVAEGDLVDGGTVLIELG